MSCACRCAPNIDMCRMPVYTSITPQSQLNYSMVYCISSAAQRRTRFVAPLCSGRVLSHCCRRMPYRQLPSVAQPAARAHSGSSCGLLRNNTPVHVCLWRADKGGRRSWLGQAACHHGLICVLGSGHGSVASGRRVGMPAAQQANHSEVVARPGSIGWRGGWILAVPPAHE